MTARDHDTKLARLATEVAITAPARRNKYARDARIPWRVVEAIRAELEAAGVDWSAMRDRYVELLRDEADAGRVRVR